MPAARPASARAKPNASDQRLLPAWGVKTGEVTLLVISSIAYVLVKEYRDIAGAGMEPAPAEMG